MLVNIPYMDPIGGIWSLKIRLPGFFFPTYEDTWLLFLDKKQRSEGKKNSLAHRRLNKTPMNKRGDEPEQKFNKSFPNS